MTGADMLCVAECVFTSQESFTRYVPQFRKRGSRMTFRECLKAFIWVFKTIIKDKAIGIHYQNKLTSETRLTCSQKARFEINEQ